MAKAKTLDVFLAELSQKRPELTYIGGYQKYGSPVEVEGECGHTWNATPKNLLGTRQSGCPTCARKKHAEGQTYTQEDFEAVIAKKFPDIEIVGKYLGYDKPITYACRHCGQTWTVDNAVSLTSGRASMHIGGNCGSAYYPEMTGESVKQDFDSGMSRQQIADKYGCTTRTVDSRLSDLGLGYRQSRG